MALLEFHSKRGRGISSSDFLLRLKMQNGYSNAWAFSLPNNGAENITSAEVANDPKLFPPAEARGKKLYGRCRRLLMLAILSKFGKTSVSPI